MRTGSAVLTLLLLGSSACATKRLPKRDLKSVHDPHAFRATPPRTEPPTSYQAPLPTTTQLDNGLTVLMVQDRRLPLIAVRMVFRVGASADPKGLEGLASFTAEMLTAGTESRNATQIAAMAERLGSRIDAGLHGDVIEVSASTLTNNFPALLEVLTDIIRHSVFDPRKIEQTRKRRMQSLKQERDSPSRVARRTFYEAVYAGHPYGHVASGTSKGIERIRRDDLVSFYRRHLTPNRAALIVAGDFDPSAMEKRIAQALGDWPRAELSPPRVPPFDASAPQTLLVDRPTSARSELLLGHPTVARSHPDYLALMLANHIFGGQLNNRISRTLAEERSYAFGASSTIDTRASGGPFLVSSEVRVDVTAQSIVEIIRELERLRSDGVTAEELQRAKRSLTVALPGYFQTRDAVARIVSNLFVYDLPLDYYQQLPARIDEVSAEDVKRVASMHLIPDKLTVVVVGDRKTVLPSLKGMNRGAVRVIDDEE